MVDKYDPNTKLYYYWNVLEFIIWIKDEYPDEHECYNLDSAFRLIDDFGNSYIEIFNPLGVFRYNDGSLNISRPIQEMISEFYNYVITLPEEANQTLQIILDSLNRLENNVKKITPLDINSRDIAKEALKEVLHHQNSSQRLSKKEQLSLDVENKIAERKLKMIKKASRSKK